MLKEIRAVICDQDDTLTRGTTRDLYDVGARAALLKLLPSDHEDREFVASEAFLESRRTVFATQPCQHKYYSDKYEIPLFTYFDAFHACIDASRIQHDVASATVLNALEDKTLLLTDASYSWATARRTQIGHTLAIQSRSCLGGYGLFHATKSNSSAPWWFAVERLEEMTGGVSPENILVIDDNVRVLARAAGLGFQVVQCIIAVDPHSDFEHIPHVGTHLANIFGLPRPEWDAEQLTPPPRFPLNSRPPNGAPL
jgi:FMN phosphatase YigB (HAD superfamily)